MMEDLKDKVILITGSSRGIGLATAKMLSRLGAKVILNSSRSEEELRRAAEEVPGSDWYLCDITKEDEVRKMVEAIMEKHGRIDGLVNNAGGGGWASITTRTTNGRGHWIWTLWGRCIWAASCCL